MNRSARRRIPSFSLYGEAARQSEALHIEDIQSRSRKYLWKIGSHRHSGMAQCVFVASGPVIADLEGTRAGYQGPMVFVIPAGAVHGFGFRADSHGHVLTLNFDRLLSMATAAQQAPIAALFAVPRALDLAADPELATRLARLFDALLQEFKQPENLAPQVGWLACSILWILSAGGLLAVTDGSPDRQDTARHDTQRHDLERLRRFRVLVESHYLEHWPVTRYARRLAVSESSLNRLCRSVTGGTAFDVIQQRLALEARRRLVYVAAPVAAIAQELGFEDPAYFCRFFRKHAGVSPTAFRRQR